MQRLAPSLALLFAAQVFASPLPDRPSRQVPLNILVIPDATEARTDLVRDAIDHWNSVLAGTGSKVRFGEMTIARVPVDVSALSDRSDSDRRKAVPARMRWRELPADIIVVMTDEDLASFTVPTGVNDQVLVVIRSTRTEPLNRPNVARNVIAHELGHALGLQHNADPTTLMCGLPASCPPALFESRPARFFPLTHEDRVFLAYFRE